jgi:hypothetical protein
MLAHRDRRDSVRRCERDPSFSLPARIRPGKTILRSPAEDVWSRNPVSHNPCRCVFSQVGPSVKSAGTEPSAPLEDEASIHSGALPMSRSCLVGRVGEPSPCVLHRRKDGNGDPLG